MPSLRGVNLVYEILGGSGPWVLSQQHAGRAIGRLPGTLAGRFIDFLRRREQANG
jgi:hypothetical protein